MITLELRRTPLGIHIGCGGAVVRLESASEGGRQCERCGAWGAEVYLQGDNTLVIHGHPDREDFFYGLQLDITLDEAS